MGNNFENLERNGTKQARIFYEGNNCLATLFPTSISLCRNFISNTPCKKLNEPRYNDRESIYQLVTEGWAKNVSSRCLSSHTLPATW